MNAKEAKIQSQNVKDRAFAENYEKVLEQIKHYVKAGKFEVIYYDKILMEVKNKLVNDGYQVSEIPDGRNNIDHRISWEKA